MSASRTRRPNILVFLTDDHAQWASGAYGNSELRTPSMDFLAAGGARMANAFTPCPVCSPARASFHTGRLPSMHGVHDYLQEPGEGRDHPGIRGQNTIAQLLHSAGYRTGLAGKWHCNDAWVHQPGFDMWFSMIEGTAARFGRQAFCSNGETVVKHGHQAPMITDSAVEFIREANGRPFFLFVGYTDTHAPFRSAPERLAAKNRRNTFRDIPDEDVDGRHAVVRFRKPSNANMHREQLAQYYASVEMVDEQVGRVIDELQSMDMLDDTLIVYTADHGHMNGHHGVYTKGNATVPQNFYEESIRIPMLMRWPGRITPKSVHEEMVDLCDLHATLLNVAGVTLDRDLRTKINSPGRSFLPLLHDEEPSEPRPTSPTDGEPAHNAYIREQAWKPVQFCEYGNARMARTATRKLVVRYAGPNGHFPNEYYDLAHDPRERDNRLHDPAYSEEIEHLTRLLDAHFDQYESLDRTGRRIADQPICNPCECWRLETGARTAAGGDGI